MVRSQKKGVKKFFCLKNLKNVLNFMLKNLKQLKFFKIFDFGLDDKGKSYENLVFYFFFDQTKTF